MLRNPTRGGILLQIKTVIDLPAPDTKRWVQWRKPAIVGAARNGTVVPKEVCRHYELWVEERLTGRARLQPAACWVRPSPAYRSTAAPPAGKRAAAQCGAVLLGLASFSNRACRVT